MRGKLGQAEGKAVAILIIVIAIAIVVYIVAIPPADRDALLGNLDEPSVTSTNTQQVELISKAIGQLTPQDEMIATHSIPSVNIFHKKEPKIIPLTNSLIASKGWFSGSAPTLTFDIANIKDAEKVKIYMTTLKASGNLIIKLNGNLALEEKLPVGIKIVDLPINALQEEDNKLEFTASFPGPFWATNEYQLKDVGLKIEYELINTKEERTFILGEDEKANIKSASLDYYQMCNSGPRGNAYPFKMYLNENKLFDGSILCMDAKQSIDIPVSNLVNYVNTLLFVLEDGDFTFADMEVKTPLRSSVYPTYYFSVSKNQYDVIQAGNYVANLEFFFEDDASIKKTKVVVNSDDFFVNTKESEFAFDISMYLEQGSNFIKMIPTSTFNVLGMKVTLKLA